MFTLLTEIEKKHEILLINISFKCGSMLQGKECAKINFMVEDAVCKAILIMFMNGRSDLKVKKLQKIKNYGRLPNKHTLVNT